MKYYGGKNQHDEGNKQLAQASAKAKVKWFNSVKGFGFVTLDKGGDAYCHATVLKRLDIRNCHRVPRSFVIWRKRREACRWQRSIMWTFPRHKLRQLAYRGVISEAAIIDPTSSGAVSEGKVKFFNEQKGFGFVRPIAERAISTSMPPHSDVLGYGW